MQAREDLIAAIVGGMPDADRRFLLSFKRGHPEWELLGMPGVETLPAVRWRLDNLVRIDQHRRAELLARLREVFQKTG